MMRMLGEYWLELLAILLVCSLASFAQQKFGMFIASLVTLGSITLTIVLAVGGVPGIESYLLFGLGLYPGFAWLGFLIGHYFRRKNVT